MKEVLNFMRGKLDTTRLKFHYLKIGKAEPLLDQLRELTEEFTTWDQYEAESFSDFYFGSSYMDYDAALLNLDISDENVTDIRRDFWQEFIWKTQDMPQLLAIVIPNSNSFGSLSRAQVIEALSLIRLTDRPFELFEHGVHSPEDILSWITSYASIVHRKKREVEEEKTETEN